MKDDKLLDQLRRYEELARDEQAAVTLEIQKTEERLRVLKKKNEYLKFAIDNVQFDIKNMDFSPEEQIE